MNIAYDSQIFCAQAYGGVSRYFCEIATRIAGLPVSCVSIVAPMFICEYLHKVPPALISGFRAPATKRLRLAQRVIGLLAGDFMLRAKSPDLIHETYFSPYRLGPKSAKRVVTVHDMIHEKFAENFPNADKTAGYKAKAVERADHVICVSESTKRDAIEILGVPSEKITVVHHGFDLMTQAHTDSRAQLESTGEPYLLYVGHRGGYKNFRRLTEAIAQSNLLKSQFKLICFGGGPITTEERWAISELGLNNDRVLQMAGADDVLSNLYRGASAFIYPSLYEGFGIPPLEAMAHGCPVVCSNTSSIPEVVGDAGEYFNPSSVESIRDALERVVGSEALKRVLVSRGDSRLSLFSWDQCAIATYNIYNKLI